MENTKAKFIDMTLFAGNILLIHREDSFNALSMFLIIMTFSNIHWLSSARFYDHIHMDKLDKNFIKLLLFNLCFFSVVYSLCQVLYKAKRVIFQVLWFEVVQDNQIMYILIKQFKNLILTICHVYYKATNRSGFEYTLANKLISLCMSTLTLLLKLSMIWTHREVAMIYVYIIISSIYGYCVKVSGLLSFLAMRNNLKKISDFNGEPEDCAVCMAEVVEGKILSCNHVFHESCLR